MSQAQQTLELVKERGILRPRELQEHEIPRSVLSRLVERGELIRLGRGLYAHPDLELTEHHSLAEVQKRVPDAVVCLLSALRFHEMTDESPFEVWICLDLHAPDPALDYPPLRVVRANPGVRHFGVETHQVERVPVRVTTPAKTVADCFKARNKIGGRVAMKALSEYLQQKRGSLDELWEACRVCRMTRVITPYLEALA